MEKTSCPDCNGDSFRKTIERNEFPHGAGDDAVLLSAIIPVYTCNNCGLSFTDDEAHTIQHNVVMEYLNGKINN